MRLIEKIEINYVRSLYRANIEKVGDLNVIFGRNDSGKSNLLRALNLFFNGKIEPGRSLNFDLDMSDWRKKRARDAKGKQFIWIKVTFNVPENYISSLGNSITVKKQWNRDGELTQTVYPAFTEKGKKIRLARFLNEIDFTYIPAIKDLDVYGDLIERMYGAASETDTIRRAITTFVNAIEGQTTSLSNQLAELFGAKARLAPPTEMGRLFRSLDFAHGEDGHSLLRQKGDGVKARHLPELLRFINRSETKKHFFLWGFEEPENSLDLGAAEAEAHRFASFSSRDDTQVFITSHSPAFYLFGVKNKSEIRRFFITKQELGESDEMEPKNAASLIDVLEDAELKMGEAGLLKLPFIIKQLGEYQRKLGEVSQAAENLKRNLEDIKKPVLFVEGSHDEKIFSAALSRINTKMESVVKPLGGTPNTADSLLESVLQNGGINATVPTVFLFDNDCSGRKAFKTFVKGSASTQPVQYRDKIYAFVLPKTDEFKLFEEKFGIRPEQSFFTAEFLYPAIPAAALCKELVGNLSTQSIKDWKTTIHGDYFKNCAQQTSVRLLSAEEGSVDWFFARGVPEELKKEFAKKAIERRFSCDSIDSIARTIADVLCRDA